MPLINNLYYIYLINISIYIHFFLKGYHIAAIFISGAISGAFLYKLVNSLKYMKISVKSREPIYFNDEPILFIVNIIIVIIIYVLSSIALFFGNPIPV